MKYEDGASPKSSRRGREALRSIFLTRATTQRASKEFAAIMVFFQVHVQDLKKNITSKNTEAAFRPEHPYFVSVLRPHIQARAQSNARTTSDPKPTNVQRDVM